MKKINKKGISPVVSTVLLVTIVVILGLIIFLWATGFMKERCQKFDEVAANSCEKIRIDAQYSRVSDELDIINTGDVPVYKIALKISYEDGVDIEEFSPVNLNIGVSKTINLLNDYSIDLSSYGDYELEIIAILHGQKGEGGELCEYMCEKHPLSVEII